MFVLRHFNSVAYLFHLKTLSSISHLKQHLKFRSLLVSPKGVPPPPVLVKAEVTSAPKDGLVKKAVPSQFPLLERVKGKTSEQLNSLEESFQRSSSPTEAEIGTVHPSIVSQAHVSIDGKT